jgi:hypothetical protein
MTSQPPDGSWQPAPLNGQGGRGGPEQMRAAWQPPGAAPRDQARPQGAPYGQGQAAYQQAAPPFEQQQPYEPPAYEPPPPYDQTAYEAYPPPSYGAADVPGYGAEEGQFDQHTLAWEQGGQGQGGPHGHAEAPHAGRSAARAGASRGSAHAKGFLSSLFDFSFTSFVTPKIVKMLYVLATAWTVLVGIAMIDVLGFRLNFAAGVFMLFLVPVFGVLILGAIRVSLELFMVLYRINENIQVLRDRDEES